MWWYEGRDTTGLRWGGRCVRAGGRRVPWAHLVSGAVQFGVVFRQHHPQGKHGHDQTMSTVSKHHRKQEGEGDDGVRT